MSSTSLGGRGTRDLSQDTAKAILDVFWSSRESLAVTRKAIVAASFVPQDEEAADALAIR